MSFAACAPVSTGSGFLKGALLYLDCSGRAVGEAGYIALAQPDSVVSRLILAAITLFIAWHGVRMMFGKAPDMADAVLAVAKIGLVLMLVTSWPAVRTLVAQPTQSGPTELAAHTRIEGSITLEDRLQRADDGIVALTKWGTGKLDIRAGRTAGGQPAASEFAGIAMTDNLALGFGRLAFLVSSLLSLGLLKLLTGVMISALPIFAGLLLFDASRGMFMGWLRLVFALFVAGFAVPMLLMVELSLLEPWLATTISQRSALLATPSAPTELLAIAASFLLILTGSMALIVRSCLALDFARIVSRIERLGRAEPAQQPAASPQAQSPLVQQATLSRAELLAHSLDRLARSTAQPALIAGPMPRQPDNDVRSFEVGRNSPGTGRRRARLRTTLSHARRDRL